MSTEWTPQLPGIVMPELGKSQIARAAVSTLAELDAHQLLKPEHALTVQLVLELAAAVDRGLGWGKVTVATTTLVGQLVDLLEKLPAQPETPAGGSPLDELVAQLQADLDNQRAEQ